MRPPLARRLFALPACLLAFALGGCGSDEGSALDAALGYLPEKSPFAVAIETDLQGDQFQALDDVVGKFPFSDQIKALVKAQVEGALGGLNFDKDIEPLLGNPFVVGATGVGSFFGGDGGDSFVAAIQVEDQGKLDDLIERTKPKALGEASGATLYDEDGTVFAVEEDMLVVAGSRNLLESALERKDGDASLGEETFEQGLEGLPDDALARLYADVEALLEGDPDARKARSIEWVGALRTLGLTASVREDAIDVDFDLRTDSEGLTEEDLPIAAGPDSPSIVKRSGEIGVGIRNLSQTVRFIEGAIQAIDPSLYGDYSAAKKRIEAQLDIDIDEDLIGQLGQDVSATVSLDGDFGVRAELDDPAAFERTLAKVADALTALAKGAGAGDVALAKPKRGEDFYALAQPGGFNFVFGVVDEVFVLANDPRRARQLATATASAVRGAEGAVAMEADAEKIGDQLVSEFFPQLGLPDGVLTKPLGTLTGSVAADTDGLTGRFTLEIE